MQSPTFFCRILDRDNPRTQSGMHPWCLRPNACFSLNWNKPGVLSKVIHLEHWCIVYSCNLSSPACWRPPGWRSSRPVDAGKEEVRAVTEKVPQGRNGQAVSSVPAGVRYRSGHSNVLKAEEIRVERDRQLGDRKVLTEVSLGAQCH